jgi:hypothetical protein
VAIADISRMMASTCPIACKASSAADWIEPICSAISSVALAVWLAKDFTSTATTANPLPDSPARAASMAANSSTELAAAVTFSDAAPTQFLAFSASADTVSPALLSSAELVSSFMEAVRSLLNALSTEFLNCEIVDAIMSLRRSRARLASACV